MGWWVVTSCVLVLAALAAGWCAQVLARQEAALRAGLAALDALAVRGGEVHAALEHARGAAEVRRRRLIEATVDAGVGAGSADPHGVAPQ
jgi:hypothetical protein